MHISVYETRIKCYQTVGYYSFNNKKIKKNEEKPTNKKNTNSDRRRKVVEIILAMKSHHERPGASLLTSRIMWEVDEFPLLGQMNLVEEVSEMIHER